MDLKTHKLSQMVLAFSLLSFSVVSYADPEPETEQPKVVKENTESLNESSNDDTSDTTEEETNTVVQLDPYDLYVTDQLFVFVHAGSSNRYRIIDRVLAGDKIKVIAKDETTGWLQVQLNETKTGWIDDAMLVQTPGIKSKLAAAEETIASLSSQVEELSNVSTDDLANLQQQVSELQDNNGKLSQQLESTIAENVELKAAAKQLDETQRILAKLYDVGAVVIGVFVGWLLTRRKRNQWV